MKRNIQSFLAVLSMVVVGSFVACSQDDDVTLNRPSKAVQTVTEASSATRGSDPVVCVVKTDTLGQVQGKVEAFVKDGGTTVVENITNLYIEGPINQTDIDYIKNLQYLDSLSLEKALIHDSDGKQTDLLAANSFEGMKSESAVYLPKTVTRLGAKCFMNANIRAVYMEDITVLETTTEYWYSGNVYYNDADGRPLGWNNNFAQGRHFDHCTKLKTVKLSKQLVNIATWMFAYCSSLQKIDLASVKEIQTGAFVEAGLEELTMTDYLVTIGIQAFRSCAKLKKVTSSNSVKKIDSFAFRGCTALTEFSFLDIQELGTYVLANCTNLTKVEWPEKITTIPNGTFECCEKLEFQIPNSITSIGNYAFNTCKAITSFTIPDGVTSLGEGVFQATGITSLPKGLKSIPTYAFRWCGGLTDLTISEGITSIGFAAFQECPNLSSVKLPSNDCTIGDSSFRNNPALQTAEIPASSNIGNEAFRDCDKLQNLTITSGGRIGDYAFYNCDALTSLKLLAMSGALEAYAFAECDMLEEVDIQACNYVGGKAFRNCRMLKTVSIGNVEGSIGDCSFEGCTKLEKVTIGQVSTIYRYAFNDCVALADISLPEGLVNIDYQVFDDCHSLRHIVIPSTVKTAGDRIFRACYNLNYIDWKSKLVTVPRLNPEWYNPNMLLYVPEGASVDKSNWNIIAGGKAEKIVLTQSTSFYCPDAFTANEVVFEHNFGTDTWRNVATGNGVAARWNTLVLPFTVTGIASENKGALAPFGTDEVANEKAKPFWLCEMTADGWKDAVKIEANKPYIYAMPNNPNYLDSYNIQDLVTFSAKNVTIEKTPDELTSSPVGPDGWALTPTYSSVGQQANFFNINWSSFTDKKNVTHPVGNCFRQDVRATNAFEAYIKPAANTRAEYISLGGKATTRSTRPLGKVPQREDMPLW